MMRYVKYHLQYILFWVVLFVLHQMGFLLLALDRVAPLGGEALLMNFVHALPMHISAACYVTLPAVLLTAAALFRDGVLWKAFVHVYGMIMVVISTLINLADTALFAAWGTKVNHKAISYLWYPREALGSIEGGSLLLPLCMAVVQISLALIVLRRLDGWDPFRLAPRWRPALLAVGSTLLVVTGMRGGFQEFPIDRSWSYHSNHAVLNQAAVNGTWNMIALLAEPPEYTGNPYAFMDEGEAQKLFLAAYPRPASPPPSILRVERPNIVIILLESWSADVVASLGGEPGVTPAFDSLARGGLLFSNFHSTGFRTEQGLCAVISGFPSQPRTTIIRKFGKFDRLPSLVNRLDSSGYRSAYYYAGDVVFANSRSYLEAMGLDVVHDEHSFPIRTRTRWGAYDEELFAFHAQDAAKAREPFVHLIMTSTSHEPFDVPVDMGFPGQEPAQRYRNSVRYTDDALGNFMRACQAQPWYGNTLFVILADHGHFLPRHLAHHEAARHRIPMLLAGPALKEEYRGKRNEEFGCHVDLPVTLLAQLGISHHGFSWGNDLLRPDVPHTAFWTFEDGFGIADARQSQEYDNIAQRVIVKRALEGDTLADADQLRTGQALEQRLLDMYISLGQ
jgi:phosphoglycerol transferase MdoB-like AlkP superfamily enzyme